MKNKLLRRFWTAVLITFLLDTLLVMVSVFVFENISLIFLLPFTGIGLLIYLYVNVYKPYKQDTQNENNFFGSDVDGIHNMAMKQISTRALIPDLVLPDNTYLFDDTYFYEISKDRVLKVKLSDIVEVNKTGTKLGNRRAWSVSCKSDGKLITFRFFHNYTLWNKNFTEFLGIVKKINPEAKVAKFSLWTM